MQIDLAAIIGHGIGRGLAVGLAREIAPRHEIPGVIIALEKAIEMVIDIAFMRLRIAHRIQRRLGLYDRRRRIRVRRAIIGSLLLRGLIRGLRFGKFRLVGLAKGVLNDLQQVLFQKARHLIGLGVHDPVEPEIEIGLIQLKQLFQKSNEACALFLVLGHSGLSCRVQVTVQRTANSAVRSMVC